jgi:hypothetical protein
MISKNVIIISVFVAIGIILAITGIILTETKENPVYKETLVTNNNALMTLKAGSDLLIYTYSLENTPASQKARFSGYFTVTIDAAGKIPTVSFEVRDDTGQNITNQGNIISQVTQINFTGVRQTDYIYLYASVGAPNQNLQNITVHIN